MRNLSPSEMRICRLQGEAHCKIRRAIETGNARTIAKTLEKYDSPKRVMKRFEYAIEWEMLGEEKVALWQEIKTLYDAIGA